MFLATISLLLIIPIYVLTIKECLLKENETKKLILSIFINPTLIYILTFILETFISNIFNIQINDILELILIIISSFLCLQIFILIFDKNRKNIGLDCFIYFSFILIEFSCISTILVNYSFFESLLSCIILPSIVYIFYYFVITKRLKIAIKELDNFSSITINLLPCLAYLIVLSISSIGTKYIDMQNVELYHKFCQNLCLINYLIIIFEFFAYSIIFNNIEEKYNTKVMTQKTIQNQEKIINAFSKVIENANGETGNHVKRVSEYSGILAKEMNLPTVEVENIKIAAMLHDIGKIYIPNSILEKPGKLTDEEFNIMKTHVIKGEQLLHEVDGDLMTLAKQIALEHHEKWNGKGYLGKKEQEISLPARIIAVADVFDALVSKRCYKESWSIEKAYDLIISESGEHFDPQVIEAFKSSFQQIVETKNKIKEY